MPCNGDGYNPTQRSVLGSKLACLLEEARTGVPVDPTTRNWEGYHPKAYGQSLPDFVFHQMVAELCAYCSALGPAIANRSLEMQMWWRDHQKMDQYRKEREQQKVEENRRREDAVLREAEVIRAKRTGSPP